MKMTRMTKLIVATMIATVLVTGCTANKTTVTTETVDITTYVVIDENEPTITETSKNEDGTTTIITKTTDGTVVSIATTTTETTKETEGTTKETTKETTQETTKAPTNPTKDPEPTETTKTPTTPTETTQPTTQPTTKPSEPTTKPTEPTTKPTTKPSEPTTKPSEPTTKPTEPTTKPIEPTTKPTTPEPTTPAPTTPEPATYKVVVKTQTGGTVSGGGEFKAGDKVTITATADAGYHFVNWKNLAEGTTISTATYTFTMPANDLIFKPVFEKDAETQPTLPQKYYATADYQVTVRYYDVNGEYHEGLVLTKSALTVYTTDGSLTSNHFNLYGYNSIEELVCQLLSAYDANATIAGWGGSKITDIRDIRETL